MKKQFFKKFISVIFLTFIALCFFTSSKKANKNSFKIGICNYVDDASLNQIADSIQARLKEIENQTGAEFTVYYRNCNADINLLNQIITDFVRRKVDLMIGIATPVAIAMQTATEDNNIPVVFSAVSDPLSISLVDNLLSPSRNITGASDYLDTEGLISVMLKIKPEMKRVGLLYDLGQDSSLGPIKKAKEIFANKGIEVIERTGTKIDEISLSADALISRNVDAIFTPTDNTVMSSELSIYDKFINAKIPHFAGADSFALNGAFLGYGVNYVTLGQETAEIVRDILINKKKIKDIPVKTFDNGIATLNTETLSALGYSYEQLKETLSPLCSDVVSVKTAENF